MTRPLHGCVLASARGSSACQPVASPSAAASGGIAPLRAAKPTTAAAAGTAASTRTLRADGTIVEARYPADDAAAIVYKAQAVETKPAVSASGARYTGGGWQWWTKGQTQGYLAPLERGESIASAQGVACTLQ